MISKESAEDYTKHRIDDFDWDNLDFGPDDDDSLVCEDVDLDRVKTEAEKHGYDSPWPGFRRR